MTAGHPHTTLPAARSAMHTSTHTVLYDPDGLIEAGLPLDREPYESLVTAVLAWTDEDPLATRDYEQIALQLTCHARRAHRRRTPPRRPAAEEQRPLGARRRRPARGGRPAVRDAGGHRALRPEPRPPRSCSLRTAGPPGGRASPGEGCTERGLNRGLDDCFQLLRQHVEWLPRLTQQVADLAQSIFLGVGGLADRSSGGGLARLPPRIPCCSTGCHNGCDAPHRR